MSQKITADPLMCSDCGRDFSAKEYDSVDAIAMGKCMRCMNPRTWRCDWFWASVVVVVVVSILIFGSFYMANVFATWRNAPERIQVRVIEGVNTDRFVFSRGGHIGELRLLSKDSRDLQKVLRRGGANVQVYREGARVVISGGVGGHYVSGWVNVRFQ